MASIDITLVRSMASIKLDIDSSQITALQRTLLNFYGQFNWVAAKAMTNAAKDTREAIRSQILPRIQGGPTRWTERGLIVKFASPNDLTAMAGFQYGDGNWTDSAFSPKAGGIPAGRYMGVNARGGDRRPKSSELQLRRAGLIRNDQFLTPAAVRRDKYGNVTGGTLKSILSNVQAFTAAGSSQNTTRRSGSYFIMRRDEAGYSRWQLGAEPAFIAQRVGRRGRGFKPVLFITDQPNYERRFPIQAVATTSYAKAFPIHFQQGVQRELEYQFNKRR